MHDLMPLLKVRSNGRAGTAYEPPPAEDDEDGEQPTEIEPLEPAPSKWEEDSPLNGFFEHVGEVTKNIAYIEWVTPKYAVAAKEFTSAVDVVSAKASEEKVLTIVKQSKNCIKVNKKSIDAMDAAMKEMMGLDVEEAITKGEIEKQDRPKVEDGETLEQWSPTYRVMYNARWALVNEWKRVNKVYNEEQAACERRKRENLRRQLMIANGEEPSEEELNQRLNNGATDVFAGGMVARGADADADFANEFLMEMQEETEKMNKILIGMREMQQMWDEFQLLLEKQGELLNSISGSLKRAKDYVKQANEHLAEAQEHADAALRQQYMIIASCCIGLCVLIVPLMIGSGMISV